VAFNPNRNKVGDVLDALAAAAQVPSTVQAPTWLGDAGPTEASEIFACANGLLHMPTRTLLPHTPAFFGVNAVEYPYLTRGKNPVTWLSFLKSLWGDDQESIDTLQELFGLLLTLDTSHQKMFMVIGPKRSGKGTIARVLKALLGGENVVGPTLSSLTQNFGLAPLISKSLAIISDARFGRHPDATVMVERLLAITGEDTITIDRKHRDPWTGRLPTRFLILTNELPRLTDASGALASRFIILVLTHSFYGREDRTLEGRLLSELSEILQWALNGYDRLRSRGHFVQPRSAKQFGEELADLGSPIGAFVRERCVIDRYLCVECEKLYTAWTQWCKEQHRDHHGTIQTFGRDLRAVVPGLATTQPRDPETGERLRYYQGIGLQQ
jgi:putative DNA primase/helicase